MSAKKDDGREHVETDAAIRGFEPEAANGLAEWGQFLLNRLADRWGIAGSRPPLLWAEVDLV